MTAPIYGDKAARIGLHFHQEVERLIILDPRSREIIVESALLGLLEGFTSDLAKRMMRVVAAAECDHIHELKEEVAEAYPEDSDSWLVCAAPEH